MKILSTKNQQKALGHLDKIREATINGSDCDSLKIIHHVVELTYIIGGLEALKKRLAELEKE